ncbi:ATP-binding cassette domain-containing protein [Lentilactobacillus kisonensis]|uniref:ATP-binding cassette domain-containing protein n=1 Tax=Lentilactobacillus kisonensis TaxID=481722 RepID=UPI000AE81AA1|nr:ATP-binding cassette domain-containing protein [Lentilactobacillus kisonensis]
MVAPLIEFKNVSKKFDGKTVISDLNLGIMPGELFVLVGSSGSGKTTTLKMINRLLEKKVLGRLQLLAGELKIIH